MGTSKKRKVPCRLEAFGVDNLLLERLKHVVTQKCRLTSCFHDHFADQPVSRCAVDMRLRYDSQYDTYCQGISLMGRHTLSTAKGQRLVRSFN